MHDSFKSFYYNIIYFCNLNETNTKMGTVNGKQLKVNHKRTAGLHNAGTTITDPTDWCMAFAENEEEYNQIKAVFDSCTDEQKDGIHELL